MTDPDSAFNKPQILATDLDGTLIPMDGNPDNVADLVVLDRQLKRKDATLVFVTGRHFESVLEAIDQFSLPLPDWIICDVGTTIFKREASGHDYRRTTAYAEHLDELISSLPMDSLRKKLQSFEGLRLQEEFKQGPFKLSFYADASQLNGLAAQVQKILDEQLAPYSIIQSVDPFNGDGLIDLLPANASKAYALRWWSEYCKESLDSIVFAGDSGNDLAALTAGYRAIVVGNADRELAQQVSRKHRDVAWENRLYLAKSHATSGVLEGCRWFELVDAGT